MTTHRNQGYSLLELMAVVAILAIVATIAVPSTRALDHHKLATGAAQVADAFRFARDEARRSGVTHGVSTDVASDQVRVFRLDESASPNLKIFDVRNPVSKQLYVVNLNATPHEFVEINAIAGQMTGTCNDPGNFAIDPAGVVRCTEPVTTRIVGAEIELRLGIRTSKIAVDAYTSRVAIQ